MKAKLSQPFGKDSRSRRGFLMVDAVVAMAILSLAIIPLGFSFAREPDGAQSYTVRANAAAKLPPGHFQLTKTGNHLRLEWTPDKRQGVGEVVREITVK
jgi:hypothetical protein